MRQSIDWKHESARPLLIGMGNEWRLDDGAGIHAAREVYELASGMFDVLEGAGDVARVLDAWDGRSLVIVVDAICMGEAPGTLRRWEPLSDGERIPVDRSRAAMIRNGVRIADALALGIERDQLPQRLIVYGIEPHATGFGDGVTPAVRRALEQVVMRAFTDAKVTVLEVV